MVVSSSACHTYKPAWRAGGIVLNNSYLLGYSVWRYAIVAAALLAGAVCAQGTERSQSL